MHDLAIVVSYLAMVWAPCVAAMTTGIHRGADREMREPNEFA